jgi:hypothetical protein
MKITAKVVTHQEVELEMEDVVNALKNSIRNYYNIPEGGYIKGSCLVHRLNDKAGCTITARSATTNDRQAFMVMDFLDKIKRK